MTKKDRIKLCRDLERLGFQGPKVWDVYNDDCTELREIEHPPRRFDNDPAAYEALKQRLREMGHGYSIYGFPGSGQVCVKIYAPSGKSTEVVAGVDSPEEESFEALAFCSAAREALREREKDEKSRNIC